MTVPTIHGYVLSYGLSSIVNNLLLFEKTHVIFKLNVYLSLLYACLGLVFVQLIGFVGMTKIGESFLQNNSRHTECSDEQSSLR